VCWAAVAPNLQLKWELVAEREEDEWASRIGTKSHPQDGIFGKTERQ
jgi:hypothetical protein